MVKELTSTKRVQKPAGLPPKTGQFEDRRQYPRATTVMRGQLICEDRRIDGIVLDVSVNGVKIKVEEHLSIGTAVKLFVAGSVYFGGQIAWCHGDAVGVRFENHPEKIAQIMAAFLPIGCLDHLGTA